MKRKYSIIIIFIICFSILLSVLLGFYPGIVSYDGNNQWLQVQNGIITNAHPFFSTFFMLLLSKIWNSVTIVIIYQIILVSLSWTYLCKVIDIHNKNQIKLVYIYTFFVIANPLVAIYSITLWKDIIYTSYLFLVAVMLYDWTITDYKFSKIKYCLLGILLSMVYSYRHNGVIVAILSLIIFYVISFKKYRKDIIDKINFKKCFIVLCSFLIMVIIIGIPKKFFLDKSSKEAINTEVNEYNFSTLDSYMLWMMGSHVKDENINDEDRDFLNYIIPLDEWKKSYNPYLINDTTLSVGLDRKYLIENESKFKNLFLKYTFHHPITIIGHYLKADALLLNPISQIEGYVYVYCFPEMSYLPEYTKIKPIIPGVKWFYIKISNFTSHAPFKYLYQPALFLYISILISFILSKKAYGKKIWLFSLPMILNTVSLLPINLAQDLRYVYINYLTFYGLLLMLLLNWKKCFKKN